MRKTPDKLNPEVTSLMDDVNTELQNGNVDQGLDAPAFELNNIRQRISPDELDKLINGDLLQRPIFPTIQHDPLPKHSLRWKLIYRTVPEVADFARLIPRNEIARQKKYFGTNGKTSFIW